MGTKTSNIKVKLTSSNLTMHIGRVVPKYRWNLSVKAEQNKIEIAVLTDSSKPVPAGMDNGNPDHHSRLPTACIPVED